MSDISLPRTTYYSPQIVRRSLCGFSWSFTFGRRLMYGDKTLVANALKSLQDQGKIQAAGSVDGNDVESDPSAAPGI